METVAKEVSANGGGVRSLFKAMRPYQWTKNLFVFAPLLFGQRLFDVPSIVRASEAFAVFCLLASALYIFNDWIDLEEDRAHPEKKNRPLASGAVSATVALTASAFLAVSALFISFSLGYGFFLITLLYGTLTFSYCLILKRVIILDSMAVSAGFVIRVVGGAAVIGVFASHWLIACTYLLALFLTFSKRRQELLALDEDAKLHRSVLGEYSVNYLSRINTILTGASIVCYALYTVAPRTVEVFGTDALIYGTVFVIYGMFRYLILIEDPENGGNPSKMLLKDTPLQLTVLGWVIYNAIVVYRVELGAAWRSFVGTG
ncbi:MAG: decaprenyl-phosphate phosphoribosyltransferase [Acidobacteria bacterium]|nr:MAG: decaprenyl-phosphate phosphoribosyltransferase [Acidobacteriota bacterium]REK01167.1 MAG: decaprenyl-phosphate phosphoribosyltransferase [Acidobacteriota bacterium]REK14123.1 MAG: decaprenyl-phosphate phosphoribosyltransferase [Acidobacteriota bacterium]REK44838.1 MAG: decaprenyl-phosphate phosphoribosyltransferase [Acidobacteriota bacterium]